MKSTNQTPCFDKKISLRSGAELIMAILLLFFIYHLSRQAAMLASSAASSSASASHPVVVIDSGHGGRDPGKIGVDGSLEKDVNLQIAKKLKEYLEKSDVTVVMTRDGDAGLYGEGDGNKKMADMKARCNRINQANPVFTVSIHQNSYHEESVSGGQVFYYKNSKQGKRLAEILQKRLNAMDEASHRSAKANDNYYLLLHVRSPIVIAECGFLSNRKEAALLNTKEYQDRLAQAIHEGILEYLNTR